MKTLIKNGRIVDPSQQLDQVMDLLVEDGKIAEAAPHIDAAADEVFDATGLVVAPGFIDLHTHLRNRGWKQGRSGHRHHGSGPRGHHPGGLHGPTPNR